MRMLPVAFICVNGVAVKKISNSVLIIGFLAFLAIGKTASAAAGMTLDSGSTAWMLTSALLVLMMTLPGLACLWRHGA